MKKLLLALIPIALLAFFITIMLSGNYFKKPRNPSEDIVSFMQSTVSNIDKEDWNNVNKDIVSLEKAWKSIVPRIQFSVERDEMYNIGVNIARLKGASAAKDKSGALMEIYEMKENWEELTK